MHWCFIIQPKVKAGGTMNKPVPPMCVKRSNCFLKGDFENDGEFFPPSAKMPSPKLFFLLRSRSSLPNVTAFSLEGSLNESPMFHVNRGPFDGCGMKGSP